MAVSHEEPIASLNVEGTVWRRAVAGKIEAVSVVEQWVACRKAKHSEQNWCCLLLVAVCACVMHGAGMRMRNCSCLG